MWLAATNRAFVQPPDPAQRVDAATRAGSGLPTDAQVLGAVSQELFGHLTGAFRDDAEFFDHTVELMADLAGLPPRE